MFVVLAFDVYGTLIDTQGVLLKLREIAGHKAEALSQTWRGKQLEYSFRRGLMRRYEDFSVCTRDALDFACRAHDVGLAEGQRMTLLDAYATLPAFDDVRDGLTELRSAAFDLYAFSNGSAAVVRSLLTSAGIDGCFRDVVSVADVRSFKPDPAVYAHFLRTAGVTAAQAWLVSSNPFDVLGALSAGMKAAWVQRSSAAVFDPWGIEPTLIVRNLRELRAGIEGHD